MRLRAIIPKKAAVSSSRGQRGLEDALNAFAQIVLSEMAVYPQWRPWRRPPRTGPRAGGRRTGAYGKGWRVQKDRFKPWSSIEITNSVSYAGWVGGPRGGRPGQARHMRARGWKSVSDVAPRAAKKIPSRVYYPR
jgi:hypothetical protein